MELKDFIKRALTQVREAMEDAELQRPPQAVGGERPRISFIPVHLRGYPIIEFDLVVSVEELDGTQDGGQIRVATVSNAERTAGGAHLPSQSRIKFSVPIGSPAG